MNVRNHSIEVLCEPHHVSEVVQSVLHSIIFYRCHGKFNYKHEGSYSIGTLGFEEVSCDYLDLTYVRCSSPSLVRVVNNKIKEFVDKLKEYSLVGQPFQQLTGHHISGSPPTPAPTPETANSPNAGPRSPKLHQNISANFQRNQQEQQQQFNYNAVNAQQQTIYGTTNSFYGTINLEFYSKRPSRWPFNESNIVWEVWSLRIVPYIPGTKASTNSSQKGKSSGSAMDNNQSSIRTEDIVSKKLLEIVQLVNSDKCYLPQMPSQQHVDTVFDTGHGDSQPYLFKITYRIGENVQSTGSNGYRAGNVIVDNSNSSTSSLKKFFRETLAL